MKFVVRLFDMGIVFAITIVSLAFSITPARASMQSLLGDADGDGMIMIVDCTLIQRDIVGLDEIKVEHRKAADVDSDGVICILDATAIQRYLAEMKVNDPIGEFISEDSSAPSRFPIVSVSGNTVTVDGIAFDTSVTNSYVTAEINPQEIPFYRYAYITIKTSDVSLYQGGFSLTLGNAGGKGWESWTFVGEDTTLTEEFKTFVIDLEESGATSLVNPSTAPDFALNRSTDIDDEGIITVKSVAFSNTAPEEPEVPGGPCSLMVSSVAPATTAVIEDGDEVNFTASIRNIGEYASDSYTVSFYINGQLLEAIEVDEAIEAGSLARVSTTVPKTVAFGSSTVKVFVDCATDDDDTDNVAKTRFIVD